MLQKLESEHTKCLGEEMEVFGKQEFPEGLIYQIFNLTGQNDLCLDKRE